MKYNFGINSLISSLTSAWTASPHPACDRAAAPLVSSNSWLPPGPSTEVFLRRMVGSAWQERERLKTCQTQEELKTSQVTSDFSRCENLWSEQMQGSQNYNQSSHWLSNGCADNCKNFFMHTSLKLRQLDNFNILCVFCPVLHPYKSHTHEVHTHPLSRYNIL